MFAPEPHGHTHTHIRTCALTHVRAHTDTGVPASERFVRTFVAGRMGAGLGLRGKGLAGSAKPNVGDLVEFSLSLGIVCSGRRGTLLVRVVFVWLCVRVGSWLFVWLCVHAHVYLKMGRYDCMCTYMFVWVCGCVREDSCLRVRVGKCMRMRDCVTVYVSAYVTVRAWFVHGVCVSVRVRVCVCVCVCVVPFRVWCVRFPACAPAPM